MSDLEPRTITQLDQYPTDLPLDVELPLYDSGTYKDDRFSVLSEPVLALVVSVDGVPAT